MQVWPVEHFFPHFLTAFAVQWHPDFGRSINPISTKVADYAHHITTGPRIFRPLILRPCFLFQVSEWNLSIEHGRESTTIIINGSQSF